MKRYHADLMVGLLAFIAGNTQPETFGGVLAGVGYTIIGLAFIFFAARNLAKDR